MPVPSAPTAASLANLSTGCAFCKRNRESIQMYTSHQLKDRTGRVTCPMLRKYVCGGCGATGDNAHTRSYCPNVVSARQQRELQHSHQARTEQRRPSPPQAAESSFRRNPLGVAAATNVNQQNHQMGAYRRAAPMASSSSERQPLLGGCDIQLGSNRAFNNMSRVTNSLYNSAGRLRNRGRRASHCNPMDEPEGHATSSWNSYGPDYRHFQ